MRKPRGPLRAHRECEPLSPKCWAILNDRRQNPMVQVGKLTQEGLRHLQRTETVRVVKWQGLLRTERVLSRKEWHDEWFRKLKEGNNGA